MLPTHIDVAGAVAGQRRRLDDGLAGRRAGAVLGNAGRDGLHLHDGRSRAEADRRGEDD